MGVRPFTKLLYFFILFMLFYITLYAFILYTYFLGKFSHKIFNIMGKFSHKINYMLKSMGIFSQRVFNERNDEKSKIIFIYLKQINKQYL
mgnify:CR=1 FL=1